MGDGALVERVGPSPGAVDELVRDDEVPRRHVRLQRPGSAGPDEAGHADFAHGPQTLLRRGVPVLLLASRGGAEAESRALASSLATKGARVYAITNDERVAEHVRDAILLPAPLSETLVPISFVVAAQHLAAAVARRHGRDPERPVGLSKVTRTC